jgi:phosphoserine phosphatase
MNVLVAFDLEGTIINEEFLGELAEVIGKKKEVYKITRDGQEGKIDWLTGLKKRIDLLRGMDQETIEKLSSKYTIASGVRELFEMLHNSGYKTAIITAGFKIMAEKVAAELKAEYLIANEFIFENGKLQDAIVTVNCNKDIHLKELISKSNSEYTIAMSDGIVDLPMLDAADCGMLIRDHSFKGFKKILQALSSGPISQRGTVI